MIRLYKQAVKSRTGQLADYISPTRLMENLEQPSIPP